MIQRYAESLSTLKPADTMLQKREIGYRRAMPVLDAVKSTITEYRSDEKFEKFVEKAQKLLRKEQSGEEQPEEEQPQEIPQAALRTRRRPTHLEDFVIEETIGERKMLL